MIWSKLLIYIYFFLKNILKKKPVITWCMIFGDSSSQALVSLCRCAPEEKRRIIFNRVHRLCGLISCILAGTWFRRAHFSEIDHFLFWSILFHSFHMLNELLKQITILRILFKKKNKVRLCSYSNCTCCTNTNV